MHDPTNGLHTSIDQVKSSQVRFVKVLLHSIGVLLAVHARLLVVRVTSTAKEGTPLLRGCEFPVLPVVAYLKLKQGTGLLRPAKWLLLDSHLGFRLGRESWHLPFLWCLATVGFGFAQTMASHKAGEIEPIWMSEIVYVHMQPVLAAWEQLLSQLEATIMQVQHAGVMQITTGGWQKQQTTACSENCARRLRRRAKRQRRSCSGSWIRTAGALNRSHCLRLGAGPVMKRSSERFCQEQILVKGVGACWFEFSCCNSF